MNDLQYYLTHTPLETINKISDQMEDGTLENNAPVIWDLIKQVWEQETGKMLEEDNMTDENVNSIFENFRLLVSIYVGVRRGLMKISSGRLILSQPDKAKFSLTPRGIKHVKTKLLKR